MIQTPLVHHGSWVHPSLHLDLSSCLARNWLENRDGVRFPLHLSAASVALGNAQGVWKAKNPIRPIKRMGKYWKSIAYSHFLLDFFTFLIQYIQILLQDIAGRNGRNGRNDLQWYTQCIYIHICIYIYVYIYKCIITHDKKDVTPQPNSAVST